MRLFVAVVPPAHVLDHLDLALAAVRRATVVSDEPVRWSARETWHLTAAFYGEVPEGAVPALLAGVEQVCGATAPYELSLRGAGLFAHRTLWVGASGDVDRQRAVAAALAASGADGGHANDDRARHRAHLTVGRARPGSRPPRRAGSGRGGGRPGPAGADGDGLDPLVRALAVYAGPRWTVRELSLQQSQPGEGRGGGPRYTTVRTLPLTG